MGTEQGTLSVQQTQETKEAANGTQVVVGRQWRTEPDGLNDREIDIYFNNSWVPAYFSDLQKGDFFLDVKMMRIEDNQCFLATSRLIRSVGPHSGHASFIIQGLEVVQAPALKIKDINVLPAIEQLRLESK